MNLNVNVNHENQNFFLCATNHIYTYMKSLGTSDTDFTVILFHDSMVLIIIHFKYTCVQRRRKTEIIIIIYIYYIYIYPVELN